MQILFVRGKYLFGIMVKPIKKCIKQIVFDEFKRTFIHYTYKPIDISNHIRIGE